MKFLNSIQQKISTVIQTGDDVLGKDVNLFEEEFSKKIGVSRTIGVNSGTDALRLAIKSIDLKEDDEIIVQANSYIACVLGITMCNMRIIDCDENGVFDIRKLEESITHKTKAVLVVHLYGDCCDMPKVVDLCKNNGILLIEDCAQSLGTKINDKYTGSFGDISCFSFYPSKNLGCIGDGGAICTSNEPLYETVRKLRNLGSVVKYDHEIKGDNSRLDTIQASILRIKLPHLDESLINKNQIAELYSQKIDKNKYVHLRGETPGRFHSYHLYVIKVSDYIDRDGLIEYMKNQGVECIVHYKIPFYKSKAFKEFNSLHFSNTEMLSKKIVSIPIYDGMSLKDIEHVIYCLNKYQ
jgi:dTDP-4-amino-4,6-dideoxygalactose transaminase